MAVRGVPPAKAKASPQVRDVRRLLANRQAPNRRRVRKGIRRPNLHAALAALAARRAGLVARASPVGSVPVAMAAHKSAPYAI